MIPDSLVGPLRFLSAVLTIFLCVAIASNALQLAHTARIISDTPSAHSVTLTGSGEVELIPTKATVDISVFKEGEDKDSVTDEANETMEAVQKAILAQGIEEADIQTSVYQLNPQYDYSTSGTAKVSGYQSTQSVTVTVRDIDAVSELLDAATEAGANSISTPRFEVEDEAMKDAAKDDARAQALEHINAQKESYEQTLGIRLGKVLSVSESAGGEYPIYYANALSVAEDTKASGAPIAPGTNTVSVNLSITFSIK